MQDKNKVTVIIPAFNEEKNIGQVIDKIKNSDNLGEIIVVDNVSTDKTAKIALEHGANVVFCENKGKGYAMEEGLKKAKNEFVIFLDADIHYKDDIMEKLSTPLVENNIDFVKSTFNRKAGGMVTEIAVKPLLNILFPEMYKFSEPISGMIAGKKSLLKMIKFEKDYGVDIGILLDMIEMKATIEEVNIGDIENLSHINKTTETMTNMSYQIISAILKRAKYRGILNENICN